MNVPPPVPDLAFTWEQCERAQRDWGFNCGPAALAAAVGCSIEEVRGKIPLFENKRFTNPSMMREGLGAFGFCAREMSRNRPPRGAAATDLSHEDAGHEMPA